jgi:hypothetical protein
MATAEDKLKRMTAWDKEPTLSSQEIADLLEMFARVDKDGYGPADAEWTPTYNLRAAAAEGWRWKAGKASELISSDLDGDRMSANQLFEHCQRMIKTYAASGSAKIPTPNTGKTVPDMFFD